MGSIEKRGKNSFRLSVVIGYENDGTPIRERKTVKAKNKTEANKILTQFEAEILSGHYIKPEQMRLNDFYNEWLNKYVADAYEPNTIQEYINALNVRILPKYGNMKLSDIKPIHIVNFIDDLKKDGRRLDGKEGKLSNSTIRNCFKAFNSVLACAYEWKLIPDNPAASVKPPKQNSKVNLKYSEDRIWEIIECISKEPFEKQVMFWTAFITGCREGELAALEDRHILTEHNAILFEQSLTKEVGKGIKLKGIKNGIEGAASVPEELISMHQKIIDEKRKDMENLRDRWWMKDRVFIYSNEFGKPVRPDSISQWWIRFIKRNNLNKIRFHDLRHFSVTFLISKNLPTKSISSRARHSKIGTTMNLYGHNIIEVDQIAASHFKEFFTKSDAQN